MCDCEKPSFQCPVFEEYCQSCCNSCIDFGICKSCNGHCEGEDEEYCCDCLPSNKRKHDEVADNFFSLMNLPENTCRANVRTVLNNEPLEWDTKDTKVGHGSYKLGILVYVNEDNKIEWETWTVEDGKHVINFRCEITKDAKLLNGYLNCFALGFMKLDHGSLDEFLNEYNENKPEWEFIEQYD